MHDSDAPLPADCARCPLRLPLPDELSDAAVAHLVEGLSHRCPQILISDSCLRRIALKSAQLAKVVPYSTPAVLGPDD